MGETKPAQYTTRAGLLVERTVKTHDDHTAVDALVAKLDSQRGLLLTSSFEFPGRYTRWDIGFINPPLEITARANAFSIKALNDRGEVLIAFLADSIDQCEHIGSIKSTHHEITGLIPPRKDTFSEEMRSRQPSIFSLLRHCLSLFQSEEDAYLGLYGAFGYDLVFQFEQFEQQLSRNESQRDLVLYIPDEILAVDHQSGIAKTYRYDFTWKNKSTHKLPRSGAFEEFVNGVDNGNQCDHDENEFAALVQKAKESFKRGDLFEVVLSQTFSRGAKRPPSTLFANLKALNPAPYGFFMNLGEQEYLVGASPEMYVCARGNRIETCPISGTIARGKDAIEDEAQVLALLNSNKDRSELTMCTDVDRNDKSRVCQPGSVRVIGRRQIEMYSRLIHTVDHVEGTLKPEYDALDAFLAHAWVVTVTGAPKLWAMRFIEAHEKDQRAWYGGAVGCIGFNGDMNTGLTLRTIHLKEGVAKVRAGATLLYDSDPVSEEKETRLKASAMLDVIAGSTRPAKKHSSVLTKPPTKKILLVDHEDSFVHTLGNYFRQLGADVVTQRAGFSKHDLNLSEFDLMVLSPGPGTPTDFDTAKTIDMALEYNIPVFGVCLGMQAIVEYYGGKLNMLDEPIHGKPSTITGATAKLFEGLPLSFDIGRYHSLFADSKSFPATLEVTAKTKDGTIMALQHTDAPIWAVQFHPESILSLQGNVGLLMIENVIKHL